MAFIYTVDELEKLALSHDITELECESLLSVVDERHTSIFCNLAVNPSITPKILKRLIENRVFCEFAVRNDSLDIFIYRDKNFIDRAFAYFIGAITNPVNVRDYNTLRFAEYAATLYHEHLIIDNYILFDALAPDIQEKISITYLANYSGGNTITERVLNLLSYSKSEIVIKAIWDKFSKINIHAIEQFIKNTITPNEVLQQIFNQLENEYKNNKYAEYANDKYLDLMHKITKHPRFETKGEHLITIEQFEKDKTEAPKEKLSPPKIREIFDGIAQTAQSERSKNVFERLQKYAQEPTKQTWNDRYGNK